MRPNEGMKATLNLEVNVKVTYIASAPFQFWSDQSKTNLTNQQPIRTKPNDPATNQNQA